MSHHYCEGDDVFDDLRAAEDWARRHKERADELEKKLEKVMADLKEAELVIRKWNYVRGQALLSRLDRERER